MNQRSLFADLPGPCPACGAMLRLVDLSIVAACDHCGGDWWRDDEAAPWESTAAYFGVPSGPAVSTESAFLRALQRHEG